MSRLGYARVAFSLCLVAAIVYNSWPLGFTLNNQTAHFGLASDLERTGQPYSWLFILGDVLTGLLILTICLIIRFKLWPKLRSRSWAAVYLGLLVFGSFTAVGALVTSQCWITPVLRCGGNYSRGLSFDGLFTTIAALGLFTSLVSLCALYKRQKLNDLLAGVTLIMLISWTAVGLGYVIVTLWVSTPNAAHTLQQVFLILCGLALITVGTHIAKHNQRSNRL